MQLLKEQAWLKQWQDNQAGECLDVWRPIWDIGYLGKCLSRSTEEESLSTQASSGDFTQTTVHEIDSMVKILHPKFCSLTDRLTYPTVQERSGTVDQGYQNE